MISLYFPPFFLSCNTFRLSFPLSDIISLFIEISLVRHLIYPYSNLGKLAQGSVFILDLDNPAVVFSGPCVIAVPWQQHLSLSPSIAYPLPPGLFAPISFTPQLSPHA